MKGVDVVRDDIKAALREPYRDDAVLEGDIARDEREDVFRNLEPDKALLEPHLGAALVPEGPDIPEKHLLFKGRRLVEDLLLYRFWYGSLCCVCFCRCWGWFICGFCFLGLVFISLESIGDVLDERREDEWRDLLDVHELVEHPREKVLLLEVRLVVRHEVQDAVLFALDWEKVAFRDEVWDTLDEELEVLEGKIICHLFPPPLPYPLPLSCGGFPLGSCHPSRCTA